MGDDRPRAITPVDVSLFVPAPILERGRDYLGLGRVRERVRSGDWIGALVDGGEPYRVRARLDASPETDCTCPVRRQPCKHAAALLLAWAREPDTFTDLDALAAGLKARRGALSEALREAFLAGREPGLDAFLKAVAAPAAATWRSLPLDVLLETFAERPVALDSPDSPGEAADDDLALWLDAFERAAGNAATPTEAIAPRLDRVWRQAALALWAARLGGEPVRTSLAALLAALDDVPPAAADGEAAGRRRRAFDSAARVACGLDAAHHGDALRILRAAFRLLPDGENALRWAAVAGSEAEAARAAEIGLRAGPADTERDGSAPGARKRRAAAVRMLAAGWIEAGHPERAHAAWELHADLEEADEGRVRAWMAAGDWERARDAARASLERAPARMVPWFRRQLALAHQRLGDVAAALPLLAANFAEVPTLRAYRDLRDAARLAGRWEEARAAAAERLARSTWPAADAAPDRSLAGSPRPAAALSVRADHWRAVADVLAEDAPLLALRYLAAAVRACRSERARLQGEDEATERDAAEAEASLLERGEALAREGGPRRVRAWRAALSGPESESG